MLSPASTSSISMYSLALHRYGLTVECRKLWSPDGEQTVTHREFMAMFGEIVEEFKKELKAQGREDEFIGAKVLVVLVISPRC